MRKLRLVPVQTGYVLSKSFLGDGASGRNPDAVTAALRLHGCDARLRVPAACGQRGPRRCVARVADGGSGAAPSAVAARTGVAGAHAFCKHECNHLNVCMHKYKHAALYHHQLCMYMFSHVCICASPTPSDGVGRRWQWEAAVQELSAVSARGGWSRSPVLFLARERAVPNQLCLCKRARDADACSATGGAG